MRDAFLNKKLKNIAPVSAARMKIQKLNCVLQFRIQNIRDEATRWISSWHNRVRMAEFFPAFHFLRFHRKRKVFEDFFHSFCVKWKFLPIFSTTRPSKFIEWTQKRKLSCIISQLFIYLLYRNNGIITIIKMIRRSLIWHHCTNNLKFNEKVWKFQFM